MFSKRTKRTNNDDEQADKPKIIKLKPAEKLAHELPLKMILTIKSTGFYKYKPEDGDDLFEIAVIETLNGKPTGESFHAFIQMQNAELVARQLAHCSKTLGAMKKGKDAEDICANMAKAKSFSEIQPALLAFLQRNIECTILVHNIKHVLDFLRHRMDEAGNEQLADLQNSMIDMISKAAQFTHQGKYKGGRYPDKLETNKDKMASGRSFYKFVDLCDEFKVHHNHRTGFSAMHDAELLVQVDRKMQVLTASMEAAKHQEEVAAPSVEKRMRH